MDPDNSLYNNLIRDLSIEHEDELSEEAFLEILTRRVTDMMAQDIDLLMSYLYRLDIEESKINAALEFDAVLPANQGLAKLILERQKERVATKKKFKQDPIEGWEF